MPRLFLPAAAMESDAGRDLLLGEIARGGMGVVYLATDTALGREVAVIGPRGTGRVP